MLAELVRARLESRPTDLGLARRERDDAFLARSRLQNLRDRLHAAAKATVKRQAWGEPPVFFFDRARQAELEAARGISGDSPPVPDPLVEAISSEVAALCRSVEVRRAARAIPGLREAAEAVPIAKELAALLAVPDDEAVLVLDAAQRRGYRLAVSGIACAYQFQVLMLEALAGSGQLAARPSRFARACREAHPCIPAGIPMLVELPFQFMRPSALSKDGACLTGFDAADHWLWGWDSLRAMPRIDGERIVLLTEPAYPQMWEVERRFPAMAAEVQLLDVLNPFQVAERLGRVVGGSVPVRPSDEPELAMARAA